MAAEPTIVCPNCRTEIKLTESLAAPLIESTRRAYEQRIAQKDAAIAQREHAIQEREAVLAREKEAIDQRIADKLSQERAKIAAEEGRKAKLALGVDLEQKKQELIDLQEVLRQRDEKLAEAQKAQTELIRKQRELDDARREMELTIERRVSSSLGAAREQAKKELEEQLAIKVREKDQVIAEMRKQVGEVAQREEDIRKRETALLQEKEALQRQFAEKLAEECTRIAAEEAKKAKLALAGDLEQKRKELADLQDVLKQRDEKLAEAQKAQAELIRKQRELDDARREMELTIEKRVQSSLTTAREQARKEAEEQLSLKVMEREQTILAMQKQIEELKRKAEQGSQQMQGEVQELQLETLLGTKFPMDLCEPVPKGEHGGDILQRVRLATGCCCGTILWESKRTKAWSDGWLPKLRDDQRAARAEAAIIVTQALPKGLEAFDMIDGVWVTHPRSAIPVALAVRQILIEVASARQAGEGQQTKMEMVYQYLTGSRFRQRVEAIVEAFTTMQADLEKERKAMMKQWEKRRAQLERVMESTCGMYGDLQGIAGRSLQEIEGLDLELLEEEEIAARPRLQ